METPNEEIVSDVNTTEESQTSDGNLESSTGDNDTESENKKLKKENENLKMNLRHKEEKRKFGDIKPSSGEDLHSTVYELKTEVETLKSRDAKEIGTFRERALSNFFKTEVGKKYSDDPSKFKELNEIYSFTESRKKPVTYDEVEATLIQAASIAENKIDPEIEKAVRSSNLEKGIASGPSGSTIRKDDNVNISDKDRKVAEKFFNGDVSRYLKYKNK